MKRIHIVSSGSTVSAFILTAGESLIQDRMKLDAVVMLLDKEGRVVNAAKAHVEEPSGVSSVAVDSGARVTGSEIYDFSGQRMSDGVGFCIRVDRLSDGTQRVEKVVR